MGIIERIWYGDRAAERMARAALTPAAWLYGGVTAFRNALYDRGLRPIHTPPIPALGVGNLSVGGTGKTPVAAWAAAELARRGGRPAVLLRGYAGADEYLVHRTLNRDLAVIQDPDRVAGAMDAARGGADCLVLDDAFQHRRIARVQDWVLVSAEQWREGAARLPAGPLRETAGSLRRATLLVVTRKTASLDAAAALAERLSVLVPEGRFAVMHLSPHQLVRLQDRREEPITALRGRRFVAAAAIGAPDAFFDQLRAHGAEIDGVTWRDHHAFSADDVRALDRRAAGTDGVLCTLKDFVKLVPLWRGAEAPLWYVSQAAASDRGAHHLEASLAAVLSARQHPL